MAKKMDKKSPNVPNLRFPGFEGEWKRYKLGDIANVIGGGTPNTSIEEYWNGEVQWFTPSEIKSAYVDKSERTITKLGIAKSAAKLLPVGTVLITTRATIGEVAITNKECCTNQGFQSLVVNDGFNNIFIVNWIKQNKNELIKRAKGSTFAEISKSEIEKISILIPNTDEQDKIAHFLSLIDQRIETQNKIIEKYESLIKGLNDNLFCSNNCSVPKLRFFEFKTKPWEKVKLESLGNFLGGGTPSSNNSNYWKGKIPWVSSSDLEENDICCINISRYITEDAINHSATKLCFPPAILIVSRVGIGKVAFANMPICTSQDFTNIVDLKCNAVFLAQLLSTEMKKKANEAQGTSIKGITSAEIRSLSVNIPDLAEQNKIASVFGSFFVKLIIEKNILNSLQKQKQYLLKNLFI